MNLVFRAEDHTYWLDGKRIPGVTSLLDIINEYDKVPAHILAAAAERGNIIHRATELFDMEILDWSSLDEEVTPYVKGYEKFRNEVDFEPEIIEGRVWHKQLHYAGTVDRTGILNKEHEILLDLKSTFKLMPAVGPQTAAYVSAINSHRKKKADHIKKRFVLRLIKDGNYEFKELINKTDLATFQSCLNIHNWRINHGTSN